MRSKASNRCLNGWRPIWQASTTFMPQICWWVKLMARDVLGTGVFLDVWVCELYFFFFQLEAYRQKEKKRNGSIDLVWNRLLSCFWSCGKTYWHTVLYANGYEAILRQNWGSTMLLRHTVCTGHIHKHQRLWSVNAKIDFLAPLIPLKNHFLALHSPVGATLLLQENII